MKYSIKRFYVDWDIWDVLDRKPQEYWAKKVGCDRSFISKLRKGDEDCGEQIYLKLRAAADEEMLTMKNKA